jgi:hypothetical protein
MDVIVKILEVLLPITLGLMFRLMGLFGDEEGEALRKLCVRFTVPALIFFSMYDMQTDTISAMVPMVASFLLMCVALFFVGWLCSLIVSGAARKSAVHACITFGNYGWMGLGVSQTLLGNEGLNRVVFFILLWWVAFYGLGIPIGLIHSGGKNRKVPIAHGIKVASPVLVCLAVGLLFNFTGFQLPGFLNASLRPFADMTVPLILFSVGVTLDVTKVLHNVRPAAVVTAVTLVVGPIIGWVLGLVLADSDISHKVMILEGAMPVATLTPVLAANIDLDLDLANTAIALSTLLSLITVPMVAAIVV